MKEIYNKVLDAVAIDLRLTTGIFDVMDNDHLSIFREYLLKEGVSEDIAIAASNKLAEAGKHPERQCYNKDGLLVTFPSPEYKQRAIARGTHFEKNPKTAQVNIFGGEAQPAPAPAAPAPQVAATTPATAPATAPTAQSPTAPTNNNVPTDSPAQPTTQTPIQPQSNAHADKKADEPVNVDNRTPEERADDATAIEKMLKTEYSLAEAHAFGFYSKNNVWYNAEGKKIGRLWYVENRGKQLILPC